MTQIITTILSAIFIAAISSWITVQLSLKRFRFERWWERKVDAYSKIIEALHNLKAFSDNHLDALMRGSELSEEKDLELRARSQAARTELDKIVDIGSFLLSDQSFKRIQQFRKERNSLGSSPDWVEYLENDLHITSNCLSDLINLAKEDLKTP